MKKPWFFCISDPEFISWKCSMIASACLACGREASSLQPIWPNFLKEITKYDISDFSHIMDYLKRYLITF